MALSGITLDPLKAYGKEYVVLALKLTVGGGTGAVSAVDGKGWPSDGAATVGIVTGSVTKEATAGQYTIVLPGSGAVHDLYLLSAVVEDATDVGFVTVISKDLSARSLTLQFWEPGVTNHGTTGAPAVANLSDGTILHVALLVKNSNVD